MNDAMTIDWKPELDQTRAALLDAELTISALRAEAENWKAVADRLAEMVAGQAGSQGNDPTHDGRPARARIELGGKVKLTEA